jgi:5-methylcytosine-specific restriction endonuclease McrA
LLVCFSLGFLTALIIGIIFGCVIAQEAVSCTGSDNNLINRYNKKNFNDKFNGQPDYQVLDRAFYDLYRGNNDRKAFDELTAIFGGRYDIIAFLLFIKNPYCYLPIRSKCFDKGFSKLEIDYKTAYKCSWDNYIGYVEIIREIQEVLNDLLPLRPQASLIDAHSFVWIVSNNYYEWEPEEKIENKIRREKYAAVEYLQRKALESGSASPEKRDINAMTYAREPSVAGYAKMRAKGICQLCEKRAPFNDKNGQPYLEAHHIVWFSRGGADTIYNVVALCPNCHSKMHIVDDSDDVERLMEKAQET